MTGATLDGDWIVAMLGMVMAAAILSRHGALRGVPMDRKLLYAALWLAIFGGGALLIAYFMPSI